MVETRRLNELRTGILSRARWPSPPYLVALSGGADSATLASLALATGSGVEAVHVDHGLPASSLLADAARAVADALSIRLQTIKVEVEGGASPEARARDARYAALCEVGADAGSVLIGHTRDDQAETVLLNMIRGSGLRGLTGMPFHREPNFYRPILDVPRSETREFATLCGLGFIDDPTNFDRSIRRNWVRLDLIPMLQQVNPSIVETLARTGESLLTDADFLDGLVTDRELSDPTDVRIPIGELIAVPGPIRWRILNRNLASLRPSLGLSSNEFDRVGDVIEGRTSGTELEGAVRVGRDGPFLTLRGDRG